jgi:hypothetical protein
MLSYGAVKAGFNGLRATRPAQQRQMSAGHEAQKANLHMMGEERPQFLVRAHGDEGRGEAPSRGVLLPHLAGNRGRVAGLRHGLLEVLLDGRDIDGLIAFSRLFGGDPFASTGAILSGEIG